MNEFDKYDEPNLHMARLKKAKLVEFDLSIRILLPLEAAGIVTLGDLMCTTKEQLLSIKNIHKVSVAALEALLDRYGLSLASKK